MASYRYWVGTASTILSFRFVLILTVVWLVGWELMEPTRRLVWGKAATSRPETTFYPLTMQFTLPESNTAFGEVEPRGNYQTMEPSTWWRIVVLMVAFATLSSVVLYGRITLPLPDLVAGTNVLRAIRNESSSSSRGGKNATNHHNNHNNSSNSSNTANMMMMTGNNSSVSMKNSTPMYTQQCVCVLGVRLGRLL